MPSKKIMRQYFELANAGDFYDVEYQEKRGDLDFYLRAVERAGGPVLEVGCGTGRLLLPIAETGLEVWGVDISESMLKQLRFKAMKRSLSPCIVQDDMRTFQLRRRFSLIIVPFYAFLHMMTLDDQIKALRNFRRHLNLDGMLILDFFNPSAHVNPPQDGEPNLDQTLTHPRTGQRFQIWMGVRDDLMAQECVITQMWEEICTNGDVLRRHHRFYTYRWIYQAEFELLLQHVGFSRWSVSGGFDCRPLLENDDEMVWRVWR